MAHSKFIERDVELIAISTDSTEDAKSMADLVFAKFHVLADSDGAVADSYGVFNMLGDGVAAPATFIIRPDNTIGTFYVGQDISDRPDPDQILAEADRVLK